ATQKGRTVATAPLMMKDLATAVLKPFKKTTVLGQGDTKFSFLILPEKLQIDIRLVPAESAGAALLYFTGSKDFNVVMRRRAIEQGFLLNEYGLFRAGEHVAGRTEDEVFGALGMKPVPPIER
ncbi:DNA polymerase III, partial [Candidatus Parvarchaeota archaeon]|nr:DNA polymerase III [Candidatus Parvarchaeota archaeon]